jgi:group I intron endonuclease
VSEKVERKIKMVGIYKIKNEINNLIYIGQSNDIERRWKEHIYELNNNKHNNFHLQNAWNKYGCDNFNFEKIEECNIQELNEKEMFWISYYKSAALPIELCRLIKKPSMGHIIKRCTG